MSNVQVQLRRGTTAQHAVYTGPQGEVTVDTDKNALVLHDGATAGGHLIGKPPFVNVLDFFLGSEDPTVDSQPAFTRAVAHGGTILVPSGTYQFGSRVVVDNPTTFIGENGSDTVLERDYSPGQGSSFDTQGIFYMTNGSSFSGLRDMTLRSKTGQAGGCLLAIEAVDQTSIGLYSFMNVDFTTLGTSTHDYTIYMDGTAKDQAPVGIRGVDMFACSVFGARLSAILAKGVLKWSFLGGGVYTAGGASNCDVRMDGTATVWTEHFIFQPTDCTAEIDMDYAKIGHIHTGSVGDLKNTSNTSNITFIGYDAGTYEENWVDSNVIHSRLGIKLDSAQTNGSLIESTRLKGKLVNTTNAPTADIDIRNGAASVTLESSSGNSQIGHMGTPKSVTIGVGQSINISINQGKLFYIQSSAGNAGLFFAEQASSSITTISDPSNKYQLTSTPASGFFGVYKSASSDVISLKNNALTSLSFSIFVVGKALSLTDPA